MCQTRKNIFQYQKHNFDNLLGSLINTKNSLDLLNQLLYLFVFLDPEIFKEKFMLKSIKEPIMRVLLKSNHNGSLLYFLYRVLGNDCF